MHTCSNSTLPYPVITCNQRLSSPGINGKTILNIICLQDPKNATEWDDLSINMVKLGDKKLLSPFIYYSQDIWELVKSQDFNTA